MADDRKDSGRAVPDADTEERVEEDVQEEDMQEENIQEDYYDDIERKKYEDAYVGKRAEVRKYHWEMHFEKNDDGDEICIGTWYPKGIYGNAQFSDAMFFRDYGSHIFTKEECKKLLNGEEITIDHFITKTELEVTIRGKLKEVTTVADPGPCIRFIRTDVNGALRRRINKKLGIEEWSFSA